MCNAATVWTVHLADEVAWIEADEDTVSEVPAEEIKTVYMMLYHKHVPKLADANILEYDQATDSVQLNDDSVTLDLENLV